MLEEKVIVDSHNEVEDGMYRNINPTDHVPAMKEILIHVKLLPAEPTYFVAFPVGMLKSTAA